MDQSDGDQTFTPATAIVERVPKPKACAKAGGSSNKTNRKNVSKSQRAGLTFPVARILRTMRKSNLAKHIHLSNQLSSLKSQIFSYNFFSSESAVYSAAVIEYLVAEVLEFAGEGAQIQNRVKIVPRHLMLVATLDRELQEVFKNTIIPGAGVPPRIHEVLTPKKSPSK